MKDQNTGRVRRAVKRPLSDVPPKIAIRNDILNRTAKHYGTAAAEFVLITYYREREPSFRCEVHELGEIKGILHDAGDAGWDKTEDEALESLNRELRTMESWSK